MTSQTKKKRLKGLSKTRKLLKFNKDKPVCSPTNEHENEFTCYSNEALIKLRNSWNKRRPDSKINSDDPTVIWQSLYDRLSSSCDSEKCWLRQKFLTSDLDIETIKYTFAPQAPKSWNKNPTEWLSSTDIEEVMAHYEHKFKNFTFLGPSPIDFDTILEDDKCVWNELCHFNILTQLKRGKNKIGIIFNTDPHNKGGEHWISMFINLSKEPFIFYFDSTGDPPPKEINKFTERILEQAKHIGLNLEYYENHPFEHQKGNTECGMYSLYMITQVLLGKKHPVHFKKERIDDLEMIKKRSTYFNMN